MANDFENKKRKTNIVLHSIYDYSMGVLWLCLGGFFLLYKKFGIELNIDTVLTTIFGAAAVLYGAFRLYRGYTKNY
jgi:hypothetical protein